MSLAQTSLLNFRLVYQIAYQKSPFVWLMGVSNFTCPKQTFLSSLPKLLYLQSSSYHLMMLLGLHFLGVNLFLAPSLIYHIYSISQSYWFYFQNISDHFLPLPVVPP